MSRLSLDDGSGGRCLGRFDEVRMASSIKFASCSAVEEARAPFGRGISLVGFTTSRAEFCPSLARMR